MKQFVPEFGKIKSKERLSDNVVVETVEDYQNGAVIAQRKRYEERYRVKSMTEAFRKVIELVKRIESDDTMLDPVWRYEAKAKLKIKGSFDVVFEYTKMG